MMQDQAQTPPEYRPGPYWGHKCDVIASNIDRFGMSNFRDPSTGIIISQTEAVHLDIRLQLGESVRQNLARFILGIFPFSPFLDACVRNTNSIYSERLAYLIQDWTRSERVQELLDKYRLEHSDRLGSINWYVDNECSCPTEYIVFLDAHDRIAKYVDFRNITSIAEIGGGYGAYADLLISNYTNIRKILLVDIAPNSYITYQYLRMRHGGAVRDYRSVRTQEEISFTANDELEILILAPNLLPRFRGNIDHFHNKDPFVEMPWDTAANYSALIGSILQPNGSISLSSYGGFDLATTFDPSKLPSLFARDFRTFEVTSVLAGRSNHFFVAAGSNIISCS